MRFRELMEIAAASDTVDYATARKSLPIAWLMEKFGHSVLPENGRMKAVCPFHADSNPSFTIFGEDLDHWSCWGCAAKGDAVDLLKRFEPDLVGEDGKDTAVLFRRVRELITEVIDSGWAGPEGVRTQEPFNVHDAEEIVEASGVDPNYDRISEFVDFKREQRGGAAWPYGATFLVDEFGVGTYGSWVIIPYWKADNELLSYKRWTDPAKPRFTHGAGIWSGHLYGEWRQDTGAPIFMCEGESDTWYAHYHIGDRYRVLGLPTGVNSSLEPAAGMAGRTVFLAFDGDGDADSKGRGATRRWAEALEEVGANVRILPIPDGKDLSTAGDINILISQARPLVKAPDGIKATNAGYVRISPRGEPTQISNWVFIPSRGLRGDGTFAFEGTLRPGGDSAVIRSIDLSSDSKTTAWASAHGRAWLGTSIDSRKLLAMLQADEVFLPSGKLVSVAGLHDGSFVWPGGQIGPEPVVYVPPPADPHLDFRINPGRWDSSLVHIMRAIQRREVTDPLLAWLAVAPLRSLAERFPFVAITGPAGAGKSETTETILRAFSGSWAQQTFRSSPHSITSVMASTNAMVIQLEEFRRGARADSLAAGEQLFREAYTMQASQKGGLGDNWAALTEIIPSAPFVVTGEDMLTEGSHVERAILLDMNARFQNPPAFKAVREIGTNGFPHAYLTWLRERIGAGDISKPLNIVPWGPDDLGSRQRYNLGILQYGWGLLQAFLSEYNDNLGTPNFDHAVEQLREANKHTPIEEALKWCIGEPDASWLCRLKPDTGEVWVQVEGLYAFLTHPSRVQLFTLPGKAPSIRQYLLSKLNGRREMENNREFVVISYSSLTR